MEQESEKIRSAAPVVNRDYGRVPPARQVPQMLPTRTIYQVRSDKVHSTQSRHYHEQSEADSYTGSSESDVETVRTGKSKAFPQTKVGDQRPGADKDPRHRHSDRHSTASTGRDASDEKHHRRRKRKSDHPKDYDDVKADKKEHSRDSRKRTEDKNAKKYRNDDSDTNAGHRKVPKDDTATGERRHHRRKHTGKRS